jgi:hypothetical protein
MSSMLDALGAVLYARQAYQTLPNIRFQCYVSCAKAASRSRLLFARHEQPNASVGRQ